MHSFGWWLQGVLAAPLDMALDTDLDLKARYVVDFGVDADFDPADADDVAMMRQKLEDDLGLVLEPKENVVPMVAVTRSTGPEGAGDEDSQRGVARHLIGLRSESSACQAAALRAADPPILATYG